MATEQLQAHARSRSPTGTLGTILFIIGFLVLVGTGGFYAFGEYQQRQFEEEMQLAREVIASRRAFLLEQPLPSLQQSTEGRAAVANAPQMERPVLPAIKIVIPAIGVDSPVVETAIENGEWQVPKFVVGHLEGTANPGEKSNMVMSGHVSSVAAGNVFSKLEQVQVGDDLYVYTRAAQFLYRVYETKIVVNTDRSVLDPTPDVTITLITCTGTWNPVTRDYSHRFIVKGKLFEDNAPPHPSIRPI